MKKTKLIMAIALLGLLGGVQYAAALGTAFTYQGRLADNGSPASGNYDLRFTVWDSAAGGLQVGGAVVLAPVSVSGGLFTVPLDFGPGIFTGPDRWLQIESRVFGGPIYSLITPRQKLTATPYALYAKTAETCTNDADISPFNELNTAFGLVGNSLRLTDAGGTLSVDLTPALGDSDWAWFSGSGLTGEIYHSGDVALGTFTNPDGHGLNVQNYTSGKAAVRGADQNGGSLYAEGMLGVLSPDASPLLLPLSIVNAGVMGIKPANGSNGAAVVGWNKDNNSVNYGGAFIANGTNTGQNIALYARATNSTENIAALLDGDVIVSPGNSVGIGTTTPTSRLHVSGGDVRIEDSAPFVYLNGTAPSPNTGIKFEKSGATAGYLYVRGSDGALIMYPGASGANNLTIAASGDVGIGTSSPTAKLHVTGTAGTDGIKFPDGTLQTTAPKPISASASAQSPATTNRFLGPTVTVTVRSTSQQIAVVANSALGSSVGGTGLKLFPGYRLSGNTTAPITVGGGMYGIAVTAGVRVPLGVNGVITGLPAGDYEVGMVGYCNTQAEANTWNNNEWGYVTATVY